jgi:PPOX class probable F420-dependent enzyme
MRTTLDNRDRELLEAPNFVNVSTLRPDGTIHSVPIWVDVEGDTIVLNTAQGRVWPENLRRDGRATLTVQNRDNPYEYLTIGGHVSETTTDGADAHIDKLAKKYLGEDTYPYHRPDEQRVIVRITPDRVYRNVD